MDLKTQLEIVAKNHQALIQNLETKFDKLADKQSGRPSGSLPSNTQPNPRGNNSIAYQPPQSRNEHVNAIFTRSGKSYDPPLNPNDQQKNSETPINFDSDDEDDEPTPQPKTQSPKPGLEVGLIRHIQGLDMTYWGFLGVGTTLDIFQNIIFIPYFEYGVLSLSGYAVLSFIPQWSLVSAGTDTPYLP
ncbi:hypothetical protein Tco_0891101 [Tanacetum coccineum]|uniref:Uncharacterized protein n=1 Tax=Tanacetum coccineum TaxID=301880 RepID=A0ABQ5C7G5_9ASTR